MRCIALRCIRENRRTEDGGNYESVHRKRGREWRAGVKPSAHVAKARVSPGRETSVYLACIHMQIPIDMTTFTYCIFALGHILARQFPIVGFRPPVRLIDIIGRAADTRLHFYLHTFANQFEPNRSSALARTTVPPSFYPCSVAFFILLLRRRLANDFRFSVELSRGCTRVIFLHAGMCTGCRCDVDRRR